MTNIDALAAACPEISVIKADDLLRYWAGYKDEELLHMTGTAQDHFCMQFLMYARKNATLELDLAVRNSVFSHLLNAALRAPVARRATKKESE